MNNNQAAHAPTPEEESKKCCVTFFQFLKRIWFFDRASKNFYEEMVVQSREIKALRLETQILRTWKDAYDDTLSSLTDAMQALVWRKDNKHGYLLANPLHCSSFFGFDTTPECLEYIVGKSDSDIIIANYRDLGIQNTFGEICELTDEYVSKQKKPLHFLEAGMIAGEEILLYVVKTPLFDDKGVFTGTVGIGWDFSDQSKFIVSLLNRWIYAKEATQLYKQKEVFAYVVKPATHSCGVFNHICPMPARGKECQPGECDDCQEASKEEK